MVGLACGYLNANRNEPNCNSAATFAAVSQPTCLPHDKQQQQPVDEYKPQKSDKWKQPLDSQDTRNNKQVRFGIEVKTLGRMFSTEIELNLNPILLPILSV